MAADPYDGYVQALLDLTQSTEHDLAVSDGGDDFFRQIEDSVAEFEDDLLALADRTWESRAGLERNLGERFFLAFRALDSILAITYAATRLLTTGRLQYSKRPPRPVQYAASVLLTRSVGVGHEICAMLRAGFPGGAYARWRTLYELDVVAAVLRKGPRGTAARYINHRWVLVAKKPREYFPDDSEWMNIRPKVEKLAADLVSRYGPNYSNTYGWATEVTKRKLGVEKPQFWHLEKIADLKGHGQFLAGANHSVHADSLGGLLAIGRDGIMHSGARSDDIQIICALTVRTVGEIADSVIRMWKSYDPSAGLNVLVGLFGELSLTLQLDALAGTRAT
ncbi:DUF5677 domain-containing protein [Micromonospora arborensis]|uniref:DUF5677 domain-containing protein n=1 Tax=Micromonospora arborensis TaxID=2116518 RepID=UPI00244E34B6|nr:DUF5677 domain-containing protein [Micromonospora arborensis]